MERSINEQAVWQRVSAASEAASHSPGSPREDMISALREGQQLYRWLQALSSGKDPFPTLLQSQRREVQTLRGIYSLLWGPAKTTEPLKDSPTGRTYREKLLFLLQHQDQHLNTLATLSEKLSGHPATVTEHLWQQGLVSWEALVREIGK